MKISNNAKGFDYCRWQYELNAMELIRHYASLSQFEQLPTALAVSE